MDSIITLKPVNFQLPLYTVFGSVCGNTYYSIAQAKQHYKVRNLIKRLKRQYK